MVLLFKMQGLDVSIMKETMCMALGFNILLEFMVRASQLTIDYK